LFTREDSIFFKKEYVARAQSFYEKHGAKTIFVARFIPIIRTFAPVVAGIGQMKFFRFSVFNIAGALLWALFMPTVGYFFGSKIPNVDAYIGPVILAIIILSSFMLIRIFVTASFREQIINFFIFVFAAVFGYILDKNVRETIKQREQIDKLAKRLASTNWELSRSNERLRIMDQRKSEFVSIVSHQLRTPVTAIKGYASLLLEGSYGEAPKEMVEAFSRIFTSSQRLVEMINDFLNISKIEQGTMSYTFAPVDLKILIVGLVEDFHVSAGQKKIDLEVAVDNSETYIVSADEGKIRQIISNLIDNAIKYTPKGSVRVTLEKDMHKGTNGYVLLKIKDTGVGLSQDDIHHLFGKFTRGSEGQKLNTSGSGLGLYVAKKMLEEHKGNIWVDSEGQGKGSVFCIELPLLPT
jgi:signal transduction histidine kinase